MGDGHHLPAVQARLPTAAGQLPLNCPAVSGWQACLAVLLKASLSKWAERNFALADEQGGFRRCRGTPDLIFLLREIIMMRQMRGQPTLTTFIDARKAYDTVWREGNYVRLHEMGVRGKLWRQLQAMSSDPKSKVRLPFGETEYFKVGRGVAKGPSSPRFCMHATSMA